MAYIGKRPEDALRGNATYNAFTGDGSTTTFDVTNLLPDGGAFDVEVFVDNVRQEAGASKSYTIGQDGSGDLKRITFVSAPDDGSEIYVINPGRETSLITVGDNTISAAKIQSDAVITAKILDSNVTTAKIADLNVTTAKIAADAITGAKLADDAVNSEHLTDGSVDNIHLAGSITNAKLANSSITINGTAVSLGGSITAGTDWQAVTVADGSTQLSAVAGKGYFVNTTGGAITVNLPAGSAGAQIGLLDYAGTWDSNNIWYKPNQRFHKWFQLHDIDPEDDVINKAGTTNALWAIADDMRARKDEGEFDTYMDAYRWAEKNIDKKGTVITATKLEKAYSKAKSEGKVG